MNKKIIKKSCLVKKTKNYKFIIYTLKRERERDYSKIPFPSLIHEKYPVGNSLEGSE
jgi:hypothetical protein